MNLPLYTGSKQDRAVDQRNAHKYQLQDQRNQVASQVQQAATDYHRAGEWAQLFRKQIIPQAGQTVDAVLAGYQGRQGRFSQSYAQSDHTLRL